MSLVDICLYACNWAGEIWWDMIQFSGQLWEEKVWCSGADWPGSCTFLCTFHNLKVIIKLVIITLLYLQTLIFYDFRERILTILFKLDALLNKSKDYLLSSLNCKLFTFNSPFQILVLTWEYGNEEMHQFTPSKATKTARMAFLFPC